MRKWGHTVVLLAVALMGCGTVDKRKSLERTLPFTVRMKEVSVPEVTENDPTLATPAIFSEQRLSRELARALEETGVFSAVVTEDEPEVPPDLELKVEITGADFGPGEPKFMGSVLSTLAWLFGGHLSWFIENREYPESKVVMNLVITPAGLKPKEPEGEEETALLEDSLPLNRLRLCFRDRADMKYWFVNILLPPWWGDGNSKVAGANLAERCVEYFAATVPDKILAHVPANYFRELSCFLIYEPEKEDLVIVTKRGLQSIKITKSGRVLRELKGSQADDRLVDDAQKEEVKRLVADRAGSIGTRSDFQYYRVALEEPERGYLRVKATPLRGGAPGTWTIYRPAKGESPEQVTTSRS